MKRLILLLGVLLSIPSLSSAAPIAVFGDNNWDNIINAMPGFSATLVSDAQIATPGFLNNFSAFVFTRDGASFGTGLSPAAVAQVRAYVGTFPNIQGNIVLFNADFADTGDASADQLFRNAVIYAAASGRGFIGEFNGAVSAVTSNSNGFNPLGLIPGSAGPLGLNNGGSSTALSLTPFGTGHPVTSGVGFPFNPSNVEFGASLTGVPNAFVLATFQGGNPGIIAIQGVPEPTSLALFGAAAMTAGYFGWRRRKPTPA